MKQPVNAIRYFLFSQPFTDGLRTTVAILLPALLFSTLGRFETGMVISLGALCLSLIDAPGPLVHRKNGMLYGNICLFFSALITGFARMNPYLMGLEVVVASFLFSMFSIYGPRAGAIGNAGLLVLILNMDTSLEPEAVLPHSALIVAGGLWYTAISLFAFQLRPYRPAQRALGECLSETARFLRIKADFYNPETNLESDYRRLVAQQVVVHEKQDNVREHLFKSSQMVKEPTPNGARLLRTFTEAVDLFEDITATYYDYASLRTRFAGTGVLEEVAQTIREMAEELDRIGFAVHSNTSYTGNGNWNAALQRLRAKTERVNASEKEESTVVLKKIRVNIRRMAQRLNGITGYFGEAPDEPQTGRLPDYYARFVSHQSFDLKIFRDNLRLESSLFRHALRTTLACLLGFIIAKSIAYGYHSYWILLTVAFILKPSYGLARQRNVQRITGTLAGGALGALLLMVIKDTNARFMLMVLFMLGTYSFMRVNYLVMVLCTTPFVLILFNFLGLPYLALAEERVVDTFIGCALAFAASYLLFPSWEAQALQTPARDMLKANVAYLEQLLKLLAGKKISVTEYKLVRKEVYVQSANLSGAFQRMLSEPKSKRKNPEAVLRFVVMNHLLFSNIATLTSSLMDKENGAYPPQLYELGRDALTTLCTTLDRMEEGCSTATELPAAPDVNGTLPEADTPLLKGQLQFIQKMSRDISTLSEELWKE